MYGSDGRAIIRSGIIAWTDPEGPATHRFLVDSILLPGNSGGPVFRVPTGITRDGHIANGGSVSLLGIAVDTLTAPLTQTAAKGASQTFPVLGGFGLERSRPDRSS
jgi:hypothetical protein